LSDIIDRANDLVEIFNQKSLDEHKEATKHPFPYSETEGDFDCHECGVVIPVARRKLTGSQYCVECKEDMDYEGMGC